MLSVDCWGCREPTLTLTLSRRERGRFATSSHGLDAAFDPSPLARRLVNGVDHFQRRHCRLRRVTTCSRVALGGGDPIAEYRHPRRAAVAGRLILGQRERLFHGVPLGLRSVDFQNAVGIGSGRVPVDPAVRAGISSLALLSPKDAERGAKRLRDDLESGEWDARFGHLRELPEFDLGYRLIVAG